MKEKQSIKTYEYLESANSRYAYRVLVKARTIELCHLQFSTLSLLILTQVLSFYAICLSHLLFRSSR